MKKILMVCLGNICRSPLAQGILESKVKDKDVFVDSAGTGAYHVGELPDKRSIEVAQKYGIDLTTQRARQFKVSDFDEFDIIYVMDRSNRDNILQLARSKSDAAKVKLILNELDSDLDLEVPDPYFGGDAGFEHVYELLNKACDRITRRL